ncbi:MAG: ParA family protein [Nostoc sp.]|uniref:ParA family protein n=1 Tax=Nostoc sp. TaxID=1180 RepID=UPI002FF8D43F
MRYAVWNNKGGVGKTFLSFVLSTEMANDLPTRNVILVDMCPQANVSEIILGGNGNGGTEILDQLIKEQRTVGGYFDERISSPNQLTGTEEKYLLKAQAFNSNMPSNLWLIAGDPSLEVQAQAISQISGQMLPVNVWLNVHNWLKDLIDACSIKLGEDITVFIDCNPSFAVYTEIAMVAAERVIVPCTSDGSSARAINNIGSLIFGIGVNSTYNQVNFSGRARNFKITMPKIYTVVFNRSTQFNERASKAFRAMFGAIKNKVQELKDIAPSDAFDKNLYFEEIPDYHSATIVSSHLGKPLYSIFPGSYQVYEENPQLNFDPLDRYKKAIGRVLSKL